MNQTLTQKESAIVKECLDAATDGPFLANETLHTLTGLTKEEIKLISQSWPGIDFSSPLVTRAVSMVLLNLIGYPHGREDIWSTYISVPLEDVEIIFQKWQRMKRN